MHQKNLFGRTRREGKPRLQAVMEKYDRDTLGARLDRLRWLQEIFPKGYGLVGSPEFVYIFDEAKMTFLNGEFIATLLLVSSFLEHLLGSVLERSGFTNQAARGLKSIIDCLRENNLASAFLLDKADQIRQARNPFVHAKPLDHPHSLFRRAMSTRRAPMQQLEADARDALSLMYQLVIGRGLTRGA